MSRLKPLAKVLALCVPCLHQGRGDASLSALHAGMEERREPGGHSLQVNGGVGGVWSSGSACSQLTSQDVSLAARIFQCPWFLQVPV